jgi:hypothetical protein
LGVLLAAAGLAPNRGQRETSLRYTIGVTTYLTMLWRTDPRKIT